jgi:two-component sensor histidine kinase
MGMDIVEWPSKLATPKDSDERVYLQRRPPRPMDYTTRATSVGETRNQPRTRSSFEVIAAQAAAIPDRRLNLLGLLVASACSNACGGSETLRPLWATEALHRASNFVRLIAMLERAAPPPAQQIRVQDAETKLGLALAAGFRSLSFVEDNELRLCSLQIHDINRIFVELFKPAIGQVTFESHADPLALPAYAHRAVILLATELVANCLLHAFSRRRTGRITLDLRVLSMTEACLSVTDDGDTLFHQASRRLRARRSVGDDLADLLQAELTYRPAATGGTVATIVFPRQTTMAGLIMESEGVLAAASEGDRARYT